MSLETIAQHTCHALPFSPSSFTFQQPVGPGSLNPVLNVHKTYLPHCCLSICPPVVFAVGNLWVFLYIPIPIPAETHTCWDRCLHGKSQTGQSHTQGFGRTSPDITKGALNAPGQLWTIYRHREHMLAHGLTGLICTYIHRTIWLHPYGWSMDYFTTWGWLLYDWTVSEWHVYLWSLWSLSYMHTPSFYTYTYTLLRFRVHVKS